MVKQPGRGIPGTYMSIVVVAPTVLGRQLRQYDSMLDEGNNNLVKRVRFEVSSHVCDVVMTAQVIWLAVTTARVTIDRNTVAREGFRLTHVGGKVQQ